MSATNSTTYYELPIFLATDKPAWLVDWNGSMNAIDAAIHAAKAKADSNETAIGLINDTLTSIDSTLSSMGDSITTISGSLTTLSGTVNTITELIGNGTPTTSDKTIIGAINELAADIAAISDPTASDVSYDNTTSGLTADDVQEAIDELKTLIPSGASTEEKVTATLTAGQTSKTFTLLNQTVGATTLILPFASDLAVAPTAFSTTSDSVTFTYEAQAADVTVGVLVKN